MTSKISTEDSLLLVSSGLPPAPGSLELASLGADQRLGVRVWSPGSSEVLDSLASLAGSLHQHGVLAGGGPHGQLVEGHDLSPAFSVTRRAHTVILGTSKILISLVTVPTQTA